MDYLKLYREMISLRGLTDHTVKSYSTYIRSYLDYLHTLLHKQPEDVSWEELRDFIRWLQKERSLSDRTINHCISQLRFFTMYVLHKPWDPTQLPMRKFDSYLPFVPTQKEAELFISTLLDLKPKAMVALMYSAGLRVGSAMPSNIWAGISIGLQSPTTGSFLLRKQRLLSLPAAGNPVIRNGRSPSAMKRLSGVS